MNEKQSVSSSRTPLAKQQAGIMSYFLSRERSPVVKLVRFGVYAVLLLLITVSVLTVVLLRQSNDKASKLFSAATRGLQVKGDMNHINKLVAQKYYNLFLPELAFDDK
jgi:hypothetical protein